MEHVKQVVRECAENLGNADDEEADQRKAEKISEQKAELLSLVSKLAD